MANALFHLLVIFLGLSHLAIIPLDAARVGNSIQRPKIYQAQRDTLMDSTRKILDNDGGGRMAIELNDYPGSGANNRHVPRPQFGRGCIDC